MYRLSLNCIWALVLLAFAGYHNLDAVLDGELRSSAVRHDGRSKAEQHSPAHAVLSGRRLQGSRKATARPVLYDNRMGCDPPRIQASDPAPRGVPIPALSPGQRPNFIVILTDDQGWDDIGLHNPDYVNTPNLDKFINQATKFDNFYVTPHCSGTRASLLTGRSYPKTGVMLVHGGYDFINPNETTAARLMKNQGYSTAHFGKWHNANIPGYQPEQVGFDESWFAPGYGDDILRRNGVYIQSGNSIQTGSFSREDILMDELLGYLSKQENSDKPFFVYYAPHAIHLTVRDSKGFTLSKPALFMPDGYKDRYLQEERYKGISDYTLSSWAMLEYLDTVLGRLFNYLETSPHRKNTYVMIAGDNGPEVSNQELTNGKQFRMPSLMQGEKHEVLEGGIRNYLAVQGPGVHAGVVDSTLTDVTDILPTVADLAGVAPDGNDHMPWDGLSFKNLLLPSDTGVMAQSGLEHFDTNGRRWKSLATKQQLERFLFALNVHCWSSNAVPELSPKREVIRPQKLIDYERGGTLASYLKSADQSFAGFQSCIAVRYRKYKWIGMTNKVYQFEKQSHVELPCNEVTDSSGERLAALMAGAARKWWQSVIREPHSFTKPTFFVGIGGHLATNMVAEGAYDRTGESVILLKNGAQGFRLPGDKMCWRVQVLKESQYAVVVVYTSAQRATFKFSVGPGSLLLSDRKDSTIGELPQQRRVEAGQQLGKISLTATKPGETSEACLELVRSETSATSAKPVFTHFGTLRLIQRPDVSVAVLPVVKKTDVPVSAAAARSVGIAVLGSAQTADIGLGLPSATTASALPPGQNSNTADSAITTPAEETADITTLDAASLTDAAHDSSGDVSAQSSVSIASKLDPTDFAEPVPAQKLGFVNSYNFLTTPLLLSERQQQMQGQQLQQRGVAGVMMSAAGPGRTKAVERRQQHATAKHWEYLRLKYKWPAGQGVLEDMWSPYESEDIHDCEECQPALVK